MPNEATGDHNGVQANTIYILRQLKSSAHKMSRVSKKNHDFFQLRTENKVEWCFTADENGLYQPPCLSEVKSVYFYICRDCCEHNYINIVMCGMFR